MTMVYYAGLLDWNGFLSESPTPGNTNPVIARGYDLSGHCLASIRFGEIPNLRLLPHPVWSSGAWHYDTLSNTDGSVVHVYNSRIPIIAGAKIAVDRDGTIYVAFVHDLSGSYNRDTFEYIYGMATTIDFFRVYRRNGERVPFPVLHGTRIFALALDSVGNIYVGGKPHPTDHMMLRKYNKSGDLIWSVSGDEPDRVRSGLYNACYKIIIDSNDDLYIITSHDQRYDFADFFFMNDWEYYYGAASIQKYDSDGNLIFSSSPIQELKDLTLDEIGGHLYTCGTFFGYWSSPTIRVDVVINGVDYTRYVAKWSAIDGSYISSGVDYFDGVSSIEKVAWDGTELCTVFRPAVYDNYREFARFNADYSVRIQSSGGTSNKALIADNGIAYVGQRTGRTIFTDQRFSIAINDNFSALDSSGNNLWQGKSATASPGVDDYGRPWINRYTDTVGNIPVYESLEINLPWGVKTAPDVELDQTVSWFTVDACIVKNTQYPSVSLAILTSMPSWIGDRYSLLNGIPIEYSFGGTFYLRDYVGPVVPIIYRLYLTGTPDIELKVSSFSIRRSVSLCSLSVVVPIEFGGQISAIEARTTGELVLLRGVKLGDGTEQLDELIRVPFGGVRLDEGSKSSSMSLDGSKTESNNAKTRTLTGISYKALQDGKRRVRCTVDTYITPGDTANLGGGESLVVGELVYTVSAYDATMECVEAVTT